MRIRTSVCLDHKPEIRLNNEEKDTPCIRRYVRRFDGRTDKRGDDQAKEILLVASVLIRRFAEVWAGVRTYHCYGLTCLCYRVRVVSRCSSADGVAGRVCGS